MCTVAVIDNNSLAVAVIDNNSLAFSSYTCSCVITSCKNLVVHVAILAL